MAGFAWLALSLCAREFHVAPMQGYTNAPMRFLLQKLAPDSQLWTEMEKVDDLLLLDHWGLDKRFGLDQDSPIVVQLGGNKVEDMQTCVQKLCNNEYAIKDLNLNCGCPSIESGGASNFGASLMKEPKLTRDLLLTMRECAPDHISVSLKCRIGVFETPDDMKSINDEEYEKLNHFIARATEAKISGIILHARPAVLSGLSPKNNRIVPVLDYSVVNRVASDFPDLHITVNGGLRSLPMLQSMVVDSPVNSYMAGRWILRKPLDLVRIQSEFLHDLKIDDSTFGDRICSALMDYRTLIEKTISSRDPMFSHWELGLPLYLILEQLRESEGTDEEFNLSSEEDIKSILLESLLLLSSHSSGKNKKLNRLSSSSTWKQMSNCLKCLVGTKVFNKWKRNRVEL
mmetsp:Transcript_17942/g.26555  ORF Transcript_17942/g.26555 Transcript_17942/m.26555 type:complete len:400 (+) Transcript_17942:54-1253(+)